MAILTLFPVPCSCGAHPVQPAVPLRMMHAKTETCPCVADDYQHEVNEETCCSLDGQRLLEALVYWNETALVVRTSRLPLTCQSLRQLGVDFENAYEWIMNDNDDLDDDLQRDAFPLGHAETIGVAGSWMQLVAARGFGIDSGIG